MFTCFKLGFFFLKRAKENINLGRKGDGEDLGEVGEGRHD